MLQRVLDKEILKASKVRVIDRTARDHGGALTILARGAVGGRVGGEVCRVAVELAREACDAGGGRLVELDRDESQPADRGDRDRGAQPRARGGQAAQDVDLAVGEREVDADRVGVRVGGEALPRQAFGVGQDAAGHQSSISNLSIAC